VLSFTEKLSCAAGLPKKQGKKAYLLPARKSIENLRKPAKKWKWDYTGSGAAFGGEVT